MRNYIFSLLVGAVAISAALATSYEGYSVIRVEYDTGKTFWLQQAVKTLGLQEWARGSGHMDVMTPPHLTNAFLRRLHSRSISATVMFEDLQQAIDEQFASIKSHVKKTDKAIDSTTYRDFDQLQIELDDLEIDFQGLFSTYTVGNTYEGRILRVAKISSDGSDTRPAVWIDCGIHAREWVSQASCMYFIDQLTSGYGVDSAITSLVDTYDFHILPVTNPDGYVFSWDSDRMWRKNRVPYGVCYGADCNRNFDSSFGGEGSSDAPCADTYHGPSAFSEAESSAVRDATSALGSRLAGFFTIHSYSQYWMVPYGSSSTLPADFDEMMRVTDIGVAALEAVYGTQFVSGNIADVIYVASGGSTDWAYDTIGVVYPFALELRDRGLYGFLLPEDQIEPTAEETWAGITAAINAFA